MRLLPAIRLSIETDETTSPARQMEKISIYARLGDHELIEIGPKDYDLDVSGAVSPFDRPGLGPWLKDDRLGEWDGLIVSKLDRLTRSMLDFETLIRWLDAHGKILICLDPQIDLSTPAGKAFAQVIVTFAEFERATIGARVREAYQKMQRDKRYAGGQVPFGYRAVKRAGGDGWAFEVDPEYGPVVAEMADRYVRYESLGAISRWLNDTHVPSPRDAMRRRNEKPERGSPWTSESVRTILQGWGILGAAVTGDGQPVRTDDGVVVYRAEPLVTPDVWERVQARLSQNTGSAKVNTSPLLRVVFCTCGSPMHSTTTVRKDKAYSYYGCHASSRRDRPRTCQASRIKSERLENAVFGALLDFAGDRELVEKKLIPGRDYSEEIAKTAEQIGHLSTKIAVARATRQDVTADRAALDRAQAELDRLAALEPVAPRVEPVETGETFLAHWESLGVVQRNEFMRSAGIRAVASRDELPPIDLKQGSFAVIHEKDVHAVVYVGSLGDLLARASAARPAQT